MNYDWRSTPEEATLDIIYEALDAEANAGHVERSFYGVTEDRHTPELYLKIDGVCWRIKAERHPHVGTDNHRPDLLAKD